MRGEDVDGLLTLSSVHPRSELHVLFRLAHSGIEMEFQLEQHMNTITPR